MTVRICTASRRVRQALPDRVVEAKPGDDVVFTDDELIHLDPALWADKTPRKPRRKANKADDPAVTAETEKEADDGR